MHTTNLSFLAFSSFNLNSFLDYFLRDAFTLSLITSGEISWVLQNIVNYQNRIVVLDSEAAQIIAYKFMETDQALWSNPEQIALYELTARLIRKAFSQGIIHLDDVWLSDSHFWSKLIHSVDTDLQQMIHFIQTPTLQIAFDHPAPSFQVRTKIRAVVPEILKNGHLIPYTEIDSAFKNRVTEYASVSYKTVPVKIMDSTIEKRFV